MKVTLKCRLRFAMERLKRLVIDQRLAYGPRAGFGAPSNWIHLLGHLQWFDSSRMSVALLQEVGASRGVSGGNTAAVEKAV